MIKYLIQKEFLQIRRNSFLPRLIVMFPIVIMCVMPWVMQMEVKNVVVDVVDIDHTVESQRLVQQIAASNYFIFGGQKATYAEAIKDIEKGRADVILEIRDGKYLIAANAVNGTKGGMGSAYLSQIVTSHQPIINSQFSILNLYNKGQDYKLFMIPALFAIVMMLMTGFLPTLNIVGEKEAGTIEQINVTPVSKWAFILAKLIPYWLIALFVITVCLLLAWLVYGITPAGPCHVASAVLLVVRTHRVQLLRHHAAGHVRHVVLCSEHHVALGTIHPHALHAPVGLSDYLYQPHALFHRCHPHRLHPRWRPARNSPSGLSPCGHRHADGLLGGAEL